MEADTIERQRASTAPWVAASLCLLYGFAKINGSQFTVLDSELTRPLGEVSGFWLTWHFFGYSTVYGTFIALVQIAGGIALIVPRTALAAALVLLPLAINIVLVDLFYGVDLGGLLAAILLLFCLLTIALPHAARLWSLVAPSSLPARPSVPATAILALLIGVAFSFTWWVAHFNNRAPTVIDGVWTVVDAPDARWDRFFFEYQRAHMVVLRARDGPDRRHHFEVGPDGAVRIWAEWLTKGPLLMEGRLTSPTDIELRGRDDRAPARFLRLRRLRSTP